MLPPDLESLPLGIEDNAVCFAPRFRCAAQAWRKVISDETLPLNCTALVVVEDATVVQEDREVARRAYG